MSDLIDRQMAIDAVGYYCCHSGDKLLFADKPLRALPSVENKGEWEIYIISMLDGEGCKCSECGFEGVPYWNYCPNCGADMRGE